MIIKNKYVKGFLKDIIFNDYELTFQVKTDIGTLKYEIDPNQFYFCLAKVGQVVHEINQDMDMRMAFEVFKKKINHIDYLLPPLTTHDKLQHLLKVYDKNKKKV